MRGDLPLTIVTDQNGKPELPPERFANAGEVRDTAQLMIQADERRAWMRQRVDALVSGFPTYPKSVTANKGFGWFPRVNYREAEGLIQAQQTPLFDLVSEVDHCMDIELDIEAETNEQREDWQNSIEKNWTWLLMTRWRKGFNYHIPLQQREMLVHGMGAHVWPNKRWIPRTPKSGQILFPEGASLDFDLDGEYFMLRDFVPGVNVYEFIRNEKAAKANGWFPDNVWKTLVNANKKNKRGSLETQIEESQRRARRGDIGYWSSSEVGLWFNWMFVKEYEGGYSLYGIEEDITCGNKDGGYLFKKRFMWKEDEGWPLVWFPYDIGNGDIQSVRGLGWRTKDFFELSNRVNNAMVAQVLISAFPQVKQTVKSEDPDKMKLMRMGALNLLPYGVEPQQIQFPPLANSGLALQNHLRQTLEGNNQSFTGGTPEPKDRETKYSFMLRSQDAARVSNGMQSLYESNYQQFMEKTYRLAIDTPKGDLPYQKMVEEFRERCRKDGVPDEALKSKAIGSIKEVTSTGAGSAAIRLQAIQMLMNSPVYANAPEDKKIVIERSLVASTLGQANVDKFSRSVVDNDLPDQDTSFATQESNGLSNGGEAKIGLRQDDIKHAADHLQKATQIAQMVQGGQMEPEKALDALQRLLQHAGEHLARLQNNPVRKNEFKQLEAQWKELAKFTQQLMRHVQSQQGQTSPQQQLSEEGQIKMAKVQQDAQIKAKKTDFDLQLKARKQGFSEHLMDAKTGAGIARDSLKTMRNGR